LQYFARAYGFEVIGTVIPGTSTGAEPSAADLRRVIALVEEESVPAIFVDNTVTQRMAEVVADEAGTEVVRLSTDSLGPTGSETDSYIELMRVNVATIVTALAP
jgi:ABC-type Zn uptake system ZnuABC Zn-binding protein ZnuA